MSNTLKSLMALSLVALVAACASGQEEIVTEEFVIVEPEPLSAEPVFTGKFK